MVKTFNYRGKSVEELQKISNDELFTLFNSRQRRSLKRGLSDNKKKLIAEIKEMQKKEKIKIQLKHIKEILSSCHT
tara:strand:- start:214 stop:441 length:228 start_codon:yes stop_codon:yes gene_type:complete